MRQSLNRLLDAEIRGLKRSLTMMRNIQVSGLSALRQDRAAVLKSGPTAVSTKATGKTVKPQERVVSFMRMAMSTTETGRKIKLMASVFILI